jgi:hypothetical protein
VSPAYHEVKCLVPFVIHRTDRSSSSSPTILDPRLRICFSTDWFVRRCQNLVSDDKHNFHPSISSLTNDQIRTFLVYLRSLTTTSLKPSTPRTRKVSRIDRKTRRGSGFLTTVQNTSLCWRETLSHASSATHHGG